MRGDIFGPPASVLITGDIADRLLAQAMGGFRVLEKPHGPRPNSHVSRLCISPVTLRYRTELTVTIRKSRIPPSNCHEKLFHP
jgi:hypothetical protein